MDILFATGNMHKLKEAQEILGSSFSLKTPTEYGLTENIPETSDTIEGNAVQKALYVWQKLKMPCFADDTGLEIDYLKGAPGVYSARYAGEQKSSVNNMNKVLSEMNGVPMESRNARFRCVVALILPDISSKRGFSLRTFDGVAEGCIMVSPKGDGGFGYDPIFKPDGYEQCFSELSADAKNTISHRGKAMRQMASFLQKAYSSTPLSPSTTHFIFLHKTMYGDSSVIVHGYSKERGRESFMLRGVKKRIQYLHPLNILNLELDNHSRGSLKSIREIAPKYQLNSIRSEVLKSSIAIFMGELLYKLMLTETGDDILFDYIETSIVLFNELSEPYSNFHLWFMVNLIVKMGFMPGKATEMEYNPFSPSEKALFESFIHLPCAQAMRLSLTGETRSAFINSMLHYLEYHLGYHIENKSLNILHEVLK